MIKLLIIYFSLIYIHIRMCAYACIQLIILTKKSFALIIEHDESN